MNNMMFGNGFSSPGFGANTNPGIKIIKFILMETGTYGTQFRRPYVTQMDGKVLDDLNNLSGGSNIFNASIVAQAAGNIIMPSAQVESAIGIANGWETRRMRWMMDVELTAGLGQITIEKLVGYTDHAGVTNSGALDPNMVFYIDGVTTCSKIREQTPMGIVESIRVVDSSNVLAENDFNGIGYHGAKHMMRPSDIFSNVSSSHLVGANGEPPLVNTAVVTGMATLSSVNHSNPVEYLSNMLTCYTNSSVEGSTFGENSQEIIIKARSLAKDKNANKVSFLNAIGAIRGEPPGNMFSIGNLLAIEPNLPHIMSAHVLGTTERINSDYNGRAQNWDASDLETQMATMLSNSVPALMVKLGITILSITSTNRIIGGGCLTAILNTDGYNGNDMSQPAQIFKNKFENEILPIMTNNNMIDYDLFINAELTGDTFVKISLHGNPSTDYITPTYCSSVTTPIITTDRNLVNNTTMQMGTFFNLLNINTGASLNPNRGNGNSFDMSNSATHLV